MQVDRHVVRLGVAVWTVLYVNVHPYQNQDLQDWGLQPRVARFSRFPRLVVVCGSGGEIRTGLGRLSVSLCSVELNAGGPIVL
jgi:hypothetical protein